MTKPQNFPLKLFLSGAFILFSGIFAPKVALGANCTSCPLTGTFLDFDRNYTKEVLDREFRQIKQAGMQTIVTLSIGRLEGDDSNGYKLAGAPSLRYSSMLVATSSQPSFDTLDQILTLADKYGMKVYIGTLQTATDRWWNASDIELQALKDWNYKVAREILYTNKYNRHSSFVGWYFAQEAWLNFMRNEGTNYRGYKITLDFVNTVRPLNPAKKILVAPVFKKYGTDEMPGFGTTTPELAALTNVVTTFASGTKINIFAPQDGIGVGALPVSELNLYYQAMKKGVTAANTNTAMWSTVETYQAVEDVSEEQYPPAPLDRIKSQISKEKPYVSGMLQWIFTKNFSYRATYYPVEAAKLFGQYLSTYSSTIKPTIYSISNYQYGNVQPSPSWPDTDNVELNDGTGGGFSNESSWVGFDTSTPQTVTIKIDLGSSKSVGEIRLLGRTQTNSSIYWPSGVALFASSDNVNFTSVPIRTYQRYSDTTKFNYDWIALKPLTAKTARYFRIDLTHNGWLMLAEILPYGPGGAF